MGVHGHPLRGTEVFRCPHPLATMSIEEAADLEIEEMRDREAWPRSLVFGQANLSSDAFSGAFELRDFTLQTIGRYIEK